MNATQDHLGVLGCDVPFRGRVLNEISWGKQQNKRGRLRLRGGGGFWQIVIILNIN